MELVALVLLLALVFAGVLAAGVRVPGVVLGRALASRMLCAVALADSCRDEPKLIAAYGDEVGRLVRRHAPTLLFERGSRALPVDFRRCRRPACGDGSQRGLVDRTDAGLPVTAFIRVIDCRDGPAGGLAGDLAPGLADLEDDDGPNCAGGRRDNLYIQYWLFYVDSATLRGIPVAAQAGYHRDDWESIQVRIRPDGQVDARASSHNGYNHLAGPANWGSDAGVAPLRAIAETLGMRSRNGWGQASGLLVVSGGSHAGNTGGFPRIDRAVPGRRVRLVPLEQLMTAADQYRFAVTPPWRKRAWSDPEAQGTA